MFEKEYIFPTIFFIYFILEEFQYFYFKIKFTLFG